MKKLLHVGCGQKKKDRTTREFALGDWEETRFDIDQGAEPDILGSMLDMAVIQENSFDAIFSSHNIEHLFATEVATALSEFLRVLRSDGYLVITCPDLQSVCAYIAKDKLTEPLYNSPAGPISALDILYGHRKSIDDGHIYMAHKTGFTRKSLATELKQVGFESVASMRRGAPFFDIWAVASKTKSAGTKLEKIANLHFPNVKM